MLLLWQKKKNLSFGFVWLVLLEYEKSNYFWLLTIVKEFSIQPFRFLWCDFKVIAILFSGNSKKSRESRCLCCRFVFSPFVVSILVYIFPCKLCDIYHDKDVSPRELLSYKSVHIVNYSRLFLVTMFFPSFIIAQIKCRISHYKSKGPGPWHTYARDLLTNN